MQKSYTALIIQSMLCARILDDGSWTDYDYLTATGPYGKVFKSDKSSEKFLESLSQ